MQSLFGLAVGGRIFDAGCAHKRPERAIEGQLLGQSFEAGHRLREDLGPRIARCSSETPIEVSTLIVGGGAAGLSAAYRLTQRGAANVLLLELERELGGTALAGRDSLTSYPWGAHYLPVPTRDNPELCSLLREMAVSEGEDDDGHLRIRDPYLVRKPEERLFYRGFWYPGLFLQAGASPRDVEQLARFEAEVRRLSTLRDARGRPAFAIPLSRASDDAAFTELDRIAAPAWLAQRGFDSARLLWLLDYACRDDYGTRLADTSAWALLFYFAARSEGPGRASSDLITWPEGNAALITHLRTKANVNTHTGELVLDVSEDREGVHVLAWQLGDDAPRHYLARHVVLAVPRFIASRIVRVLRESGDRAEGFDYAPWVVANLHLSERPLERGSPPAWDNVLYDSPSLGYVCATHQRGSDFGPTIFTYYLPLAHVDSSRERTALLGADHASYRDAVLADVSRAHPNLREVTERLDVFRWGHAMIRPRPGFIFSETRQKSMRALGRIHFAHTDLSGIALFEEAFDHGLRAADEVLMAEGS